MPFPQTYQTDGVQTVWSFDFPYLDRSHIFVTVNEAARAFTFVDDHTLKIVDLFGNPLAEGLPLKIQRATPDIVEFAAFKDAANLTADDLNRARLQVLFLIQERSGGIAGSVGTVIQLLSNEIETISGALDSLAETQGILQAGLQTLDGLSAKVTAVENGAKALQDQINQEITDRDAANSQLTQRLDALTVEQDNMSASFHSDINLLQSGQAVLASKTDSLEAKIDNLDLGNSDEEDLSASIIQAAIASVKKDSALAQQITTLEADVNNNVKALIQTEQTVRAAADGALAEQITTLQTQIDDNLAQVVQDMQTKIDTTNGKVTGLSAQYSLKAVVQRADGKPVMAGIGLAATANDDYVGSEIIMQADKLLFVAPGSTNDTPKGILEAGLVDGSPTVVIPSNMMGDRKYPGRLLVDGSVEARSIKANTITGDKLVAGTITTDLLSVGLGVNLLKNSEFVNLDGWFYADNVGGSGQSYALDLPGWFPVGAHAAYILSNGTWSSTSPDVYVAEFYSDTCAVVASSYYEYSAYVGIHRCIGDVGIQWLDSAGAVISNSGFGTPSATRSTVGQMAGGQALSGYLRLGAIAQAPVNAAGARLIVRKGMNNTDVSSYMFLTHPMVAETTASATRLRPYNPAGLGTLITPSGISTPSLSALSANIGLLRTATTGARLEIESNQLRVYDSNNVLRVRMGIF
jgi:hypothetical protein